MLLAFDLATNLGACWGRGDTLPSLAHHRLPSTGDDVGAFLAAYEDFLRPLIDTVNPTVVAFEAPILAKVTNVTTVRKLHGLANLTELVCHREGIECREATTSQVKKALTGKGTALKHDMVRACRAYGLEPHTYTKDGEDASDEADAFGCWLACLRLRFPAHADRWTCPDDPFARRAA